MINRRQILKAIGLTPLIGLVGFKSKPRWIIKTSPPFGKPEITKSEGIKSNEVPHRFTEGDIAVEIQELPNEGFIVQAYAQDTVKRFETASHFNDREEWLNQKETWFKNAKHTLSKA